jgi:hypothetical protein
MTDSQDVTCPQKIESLDNARQFFRYLYRVENLCFHPDDSFIGYVNFETGEPCFNAEQSLKFDDLMTQAFEVCCPYTVGMEVGREEGFFPPEEDED